MLIEHLDNKSYIVLRKRVQIFIAFLLTIPWTWDGKIHWNLSTLTMTHFDYLVNIAADDLATQEAKASITMALA